MPRSPRPSIVIRPKGTVGVILHRDGSVRFHLLGKGEMPAPDHAFEPFDLVTDKTWNMAAAGLSSIREAFEAKDKLEATLDVLQQFVEGNECYHDEQGQTKSGVSVCLKEGCKCAAADALLVEDYETARKPKRTRKTKGKQAVLG